MKVIKREILGVFEIHLEPLEDSRGFFMRVYDKEIFGKRGIDREWVQENHSLSAKGGTLRGMHFQYPPFSETKLIRVIRGSIFDVFLDIRKGSPTFGKHGSVELSDKNKKMVYLPQGIAHGFCTLTDNCEVLYKVDNYYSPEKEGIIKWDDPAIGINWPFSKPIMSEKDRAAKSFKEFTAATNGGITI